MLEEELKVFSWNGFSVEQQDAGSHLLTKPRATNFDPNVAAELELFSQKEKKFKCPDWNPMFGLTIKMLKNDPTCSLMGPCHCQTVTYGDVR